MSGLLYLLIALVVLGSLVTYMIGRHITAVKEETTDLIKRVLTNGWIGGHVVPPTAAQAALFEKLKVYTVLRKDGKYVVSVDGPYGINHRAWLCPTMESAKEREKEMAKRLRDWIKLPKLVPGVKNVTNIGGKK